MLIMELLEISDGFDSTSTADILPFDLEVLALNYENINQVANCLTMGDKELDACIENLIAGMAV